MIPRLIEKLVIKSLKIKKIILILGARQVGKTTLINSVRARLFSKKVSLYFNCDIEEDRKTINTTSLIELKKLSKG